jgi:hypothetical protein
MSEVFAETRCRIEGRFAVAGAHTNRRATAQWMPFIRPLQLYNRIVFIRRFLLHWITVLLLLSACAGQPAKTVKPIVTIVTPPQGAQYDPGEPVNLTIAAAASAGVNRIELSVNGAVVATQVNPEPSQTFSTRITYLPPAQGRSELQVVAIDSAGASSDPFAITVMIGQEPTPTPLPAAPAADALATPAPVVDAKGCVLAATFLQDVTVPDGTAVRAGSTFTKTWRMKNTSSCDWGEGFTIAFLQDTPMSAAGSAPVRPTPSNANVDVSVALTAPAQAGVYTSTWRLKDAAGQPFGNVVYLVIRVP